MPPNRICVLPLISCGRPARSELNRSNDRSSSGHDVVLGRLDQEQSLQFGELLGMGLRQVVRLGPVGVGVVQLPDVLVERLLQRPDPRHGVPGHRGPPLVVDAAVAEHLEVLRRVTFRGIRVVERVHHAGALVAAPAARCSRSSEPEFLRLRESSARRRSRVRTANGPHPCASMPVGPVHDRAVAGTTPVRRDLLRPLVRRVHRVGPADRIVVGGFRAAEVVDLAHQELGRLDPAHPVEHRDLVEATVRRPLGGGAVVADDVVDQRVVEDAEILAGRRRADRCDGRCARGSRRRSPSHERGSA